jgi:hypothetical protein
VATEDILVCWYASDTTLLGSVDEKSGHVVGLTSSRSHVSSISMRVLDAWPGEVSQRNAATGNKKQRADGAISLVMAHAPARRGRR